jgi:hypothetical protein
MLASAKKCAISRSHLRGRTCQKKHNDAVQMKAGAELLIASAGLSQGTKGPRESICGSGSAITNAAAPPARRREKSGGRKKSAAVLDTKRSEAIMRAACFCCVLKMGFDRIGTRATRRRRRHSHFHKIQWCRQAACAVYRWCFCLRAGCSRLRSYFVCATHAPVNSDTCEFCARIVRPATYPGPSRLLIKF